MVNCSVSFPHLALAAVHSQQNLMYSSLCRLVFFEAIISDRKRAHSEQMEADPPYPGILPPIRMDLVRSKAAVVKGALLARLEAMLI